jgi:hypothetical protein
MDTAAKIMLRKGIERFGTRHSDIASCFPGKNIRGDGMTVFHGVFDTPCDFIYLTMEDLKTHQWYRYDDMIIGVKDKCYLHCQMSPCNHLYGSNICWNRRIREAILYRIAPLIIANAFLNWKWKKNHLHNPYDPIGKRWLERRAQKDCDDASLMS